MIQMRFLSLKKHLILNLVYMVALEQVLQDEQKLYMQLLDVIKFLKQCGQAIKH